MSKVLSHIYRKLGISRVCTSPYHPQSNGRLERFGTLKTMLTKLIDSQHNWPDFIDVVLFFIRNIPHSRHGYTPHELLFIKPTPFILSTLKNFWLSDNQSNLNLPQFIQYIDAQAACTNALVKKCMKSKVAKSRLSKEETALSSLKIGSLVLRRVPGLNRCLESSWEGPYRIVKLLHPVNCVIKEVDKKSKHITVHASQLKLVGDASVYRFVSVIDDPLEEPRHKHNVELPMSLTAEQTAELDSVLARYPSVFADTPGLTNAAVHTITLSSSTPVWTPPYSVPVAYRESFRKEIESLLELNIIEPSSSAWSSSPLPVREEGWWNLCGR